MMISSTMEQIMSNAVSAIDLQSSKASHPRNQKRRFLSSLPDRHTAHQSKLFYLFCVPPILCVSTIVLPPSIGACGWLRYYESIWMMNISLILIHAIISLTLSHDKDQELIEHPSVSDQCLRRAACMNQHVSNSVFADASRHKLTVDLERIRLRRIALPRLPLVLHLIIILVAGGTTAYYPYTTTDAVAMPLILPAFFFVWYFLFKLRQAIVRNYPIALKRVIFVQQTLRHFFLWVTLQLGVILWYASWWITAQPSFEPYFNLESTKRSNCSASPAMNMTLYAYFQNETEVKRVAMVRPVILTVVSLSNSLVIVQISFLFAYQTIVLGFNPIAKHSSFGQIPVSVTLQLIGLVVSTLACVARVFRDSMLMTTFIAFVHSPAAATCRCHLCLDRIIFGDGQLPARYTTEFYIPSYDLATMGVMQIGQIFVAMLMMYDFCVQGKYLTGIESILHSYRSAGSSSGGSADAAAGGRGEEEDTSTQSCGTCGSRRFNSVVTGASGDIVGRPMKHHIFISYAHMSGGDQTRLLYGELNRRGINSWYDQRKQELDITVTGMMAGIESSAVFFLFLSGQRGDCVLNRPYPRVEIEMARSLGKRIVLVKEKDNEQMNFQMDRWQLAKGSPERNALIAESTKLFADYGMKGYRNESGRRRPKKDLVDEKEEMEIIKHVYLNSNLVDKNLMEEMKEENEVRGECLICKKNVTVKHKRIKMSPGKYVHEACDKYVKEKEERGECEMEEMVEMEKMEGGGKKVDEITHGESVYALGEGEVVDKEEKEEKEEKKKEEEDKEEEEEKKEEEGGRVVSTASCEADDEDFTQFIEELFSCTRIIRYDRDIGKLNVMMEDIVSQITEGIVETSSTPVRWPYGVKRCN